MTEELHTKIVLRLKGNRKLPNPFMGDNAFLAKLLSIETLDDKRSHVVEANPLHYSFGDTIKPWKPWLSYADNINCLYLGEPRGQSKARPNKETGEANDRT